jgi:hypothetical protein
VTTSKVAEGFRDKWTLVKVYPTPIWQGQNTQARNIKAGVDALLNNFKKEDIEAVFIIEDDDYYKPNYLERMMARRGNFDIWGEVNTIYYNVLYRRYAANNNNAHVSLFQTAVSVDGLLKLESCYYHKFIDCVLWTLLPNKLLFFENFLAVGIKGMPGRGGIGAGHSRMMAMKDDSNLYYLRSLIGEEDAKLYERYYRDSCQSQHSLFTKKRL